MAFGEENDPAAWSVDVSSFASSLAKQAKATASSLVDEAVAFANEAVTVKTREDLALRPDQHHIALARQHRDLGARSTQLEGLVLEKRRELEESLVRIEELQARAEPLPLPSGYADSCCALVHWCVGALVRIVPRCCWRPHPPPGHAHPGHRPGGHRPSPVHPGAPRRAASAARARGGGPPARGCRAASPSAPPGCWWWRGARRRAWTRAVCHSASAVLVCMGDPYENNRQ